MEYFYEIVKTESGFPGKAFIHSINSIDMHWHNEIEIILVLQGSVNIRAGNEVHLLKENDFILLNCNEIHNTARTIEGNVLLALQINPDYFFAYYPDLKRMVFDCKSFLYGEEEQERFDVIRYHIAKIIWEANKKKEGYQFIIGSEIFTLAAHIINNFDYTYIDAKEAIGKSRDIERLKSIIDYINENMDKKLTLKEIAEEQELSPFYLSHFIKKKLGMTFQEYLKIIRLDKAVNMLINTSKNITEISYDSGYPSTKAFNRVFKEFYGCSPTEYRKEIVDIPQSMRVLEADNMDEKKSRTYLDVDRNAALKKLFSYLSFKKEKRKSNAKATKEMLSTDIKSEGRAFIPYWKKLITCGRAAEVLRKDVQDQLRDMQKEIGFEYIRFHGIFSDDMMICDTDDKGRIKYNWSYVDEIFDFFLEVNIKPFVELGFMPDEIKRSGERIFHWGANISQPKDIRLWTGLVQAFLKHCINRYGKKEVESWYFEVWNEPDLEYVFWIGSIEEYFNFYRETVKAIKAMSPIFRVGGPAITYQTLKEGTWFEDFLSYCHNNHAPLDFVTLHIYPESFSSKKEVQNLMVLMKKGLVTDEVMKRFNSLRRIYFDNNHTYDTLVSSRKKIKEHMSHDPELHVTEWNASAYNRNLIHDTCFSAAFVTYNVLSCIGRADSLGYWMFSDIQEEVKPSDSPFHGGFGLINKNGLKKPSYWAYYLLSKLGDRIIAQGEGYIITKKDEDIQILLYNYAYFDELFMMGDTSALTNEERYSVFEEKPEKEINLNLMGLFGDYKLTSYKLNRDNGSVFDEWARMGYPKYMTKEELKYLQGRAYPCITVEQISIAGDYDRTVCLPVHGIEMAIFQKIYGI